MSKDRNGAWLQLWDLRTLDAKAFLENTVSNIFGNLFIPNFLSLSASLQSGSFQELWHAHASYWVLHGSVYSFPLVRYSCLLSAGVLHAPLCLKLYSWCICGETCTPRPPTHLPSCSFPSNFIFNCTSRLPLNMMNYFLIQICLSGLSVYESDGTWAR